MRDGGQGRGGDQSKRVVVRVVMELGLGDEGQEMDDSVGNKGQGRG